MNITGFNILMFSTALSFAQNLPFDQDTTISSSLIQFGGGKSIWADVNNDSLPDLILSGYVPADQANKTVIYTNTGLGTFNVRQTIPTGAWINGDIAAGDVDNDGDLDLMITGGGLTVLMINVNGQYFWDQNQSFPSLLYSTAEWGDIDNDGDLDLFLMGLKLPEQRVFTRIYINNPIGTLTVDETQILAALGNGDAAFGDYDQDGDLDLVVGGQSAGTLSHVMKIYKNEPTGRLIEDTNQLLTGLKASSVVWADVDTDGDLDLITTGWDGDTLGISTTVAYRNEPVGTLNAFDSGIKFGGSYGSISAGDLDADGDVDLLISGADTVNFNAEAIITLKGKLFKNDGEGLYQAAGIYESIQNSSLGEFNQDGKADIFLNGYGHPDTVQTAFSSLYVNQFPGVNKLPQPPENLSSFFVGNRMILSWSEGKDNETLRPGLQYSIRLGTTSGSNNVYSGILPLGVSNIGQNLVKVFENKSHGTYYWSVKTHDQGFQYSAWSKEDTLTVNRLVESIQSLSGVRFNTAAWVDYNGDEELDLALTGISFALGDTAMRLFRNAPPGLLTQDFKQEIKSVVGGSMAWGDVDNDGFLDFVLSGLVDLAPATYLYRWIPALDRFRPVSNHGLPSVWGGSQRTSWGDYNLDGTLDILIGGCDESPDLITGCPDGHWTLALYANNGNNSFTKDSLQKFTTLGPAMFELNDANRDGYLDFVVAGPDSSGQSMLLVYQSDSTGLFTLTDSLIDEGPATGALDWGDYNNDGLPDLAMAGLYGTGPGLKIFPNDNGHFKSASAISLDGGVYFGSLDWGDYDNDGDLDLAIAGNTLVDSSTGKDPVTQVWINENGSFGNYDSLEGAGLGTVRWGDYDGDGDLDLMVAGTGQEGNDFAKVFDNLEGVLNENYNPIAPFGLLAMVDVSRVDLSWNQGQDIESPFSDKTISEALTYSVRVGTSFGSNDILSGAAPNGDGKLGTAVNKRIKDLADGTYYWQVRTVDQSYALSPWSSSSSFYIDTKAPVVDTLIANFSPNNSVVIVVKFEEQFGMDILNGLNVSATHPDNAVADTFLVAEQSFSGNVWTGSLALPEAYPGNSIKISASHGRDLRGNEMDPIVLYRSPSKVLASQGGTLISADGMATLQLSPNAVAEDVIVSIVGDIGTVSGIEDSGWVQIGSLYIIKPDSLNLSKSAVLKITPAQTILDFSLYETLSIARISEGSEVVPVGGTTLKNAEKVTITAAIDSLGTFGVFGALSKQGNWVEGLSDLSCQPRVFSPEGSVFSAMTHILFTLSEPEPVSIRIFNPAGRLRRTIVKDEAMGPGSNGVEWDGRDTSGKVVKSGLYIVVIEAGDEKQAITVGVLNQ